MVILSNFGNSQIKFVKKIGLLSHNPIFNHDDKIAFYTYFENLHKTFFKKSTNTGLYILLILFVPGI